MGFNRLTPATLQKYGRLTDGEEIVEAAPAKSRHIDERNMAILEQSLGGTSAVRAWAKGRGLTFATVLESDLVITNRAVYYVAYNPQILSFVEWESLSDVEVGTARWLAPLIPVTVVYRSGRRETYQVSRGAAKPIADRVRHFLCGE